MLNMNDKNKTSLFAEGTFLSAEGLCVSRGGRRVLSGLSFTLSPCLTGLLGRNGAGKTTLIQTLLGLCPSEEGRVTLFDPVRFRGKEALDLAALTGRERAALLSYAPQDTGAVPHCTVLDFVVSGQTPKLGFFGNPGEREYAAAKEAAAFAGIGTLSERYMDEISGGERRLAYLARAKAQGAVWMLLDEPAAGLDFGRQHDFFAALKRYLRETGTGAIVSIHDPVLASAYCDTVLILREERITAQLDTASCGFTEKYRGELEALYGKSIFLTERHGRSNAENQRIYQGGESCAGIRAESEPEQSGSRRYAVAENEQWPGSESH